MKAKMASMIRLQEAHTKVEQQLGEQKEHVLLSKTLLAKLRFILNEMTSSRKQMLVLSELNQKLIRPTYYGKLTQTDLDQFKNILANLSLGSLKMETMGDLVYFTDSSREDLRTPQHLNITEMVFSHEIN